MANRKVSINLDARLRDCQQKNAAVSWPLPLDRRVDHLLERVEEIGERSTRKEIVAAIMLAFPDDPEGLSAALRRYRTALVRDALPTLAESGTVISLPLHRPGPRR